ncbi:MAG TPA: squalene/phytoene synthase family protein [Stellaceae bacterium]|nr:squalene/phytoene synthase family protein [Stellaceae bacterium]
MRRHDRDRYQTALFAPAARREALFALYAFNYEIARVREAVTQPTLGRIRLEWWREVIAGCYAGGPVRRHPVAAALAAAIRERSLTSSHFDRLIDAREADFAEDPPATLGALEDYAEGTTAPLIALALEILGVTEPSAFAVGRDVAIAFALAGLLRALPFLSARGRLVIPADIVMRAHLNLDERLQPSPALCAAVAEIAARAAGHLQKARAHRRSVPPAALPALLCAIIADRSLRRLQKVGYNPFSEKSTRPDPLQICRLTAAALRRRF